MIKLINYLPYGVKKEEYISKSCIHSMERKDDFTHICMDGGYSLSVRETPEEILAMPDIETTEKVIDWEQRRFDVICQLFVRFYPISQDCLPYFLGDILPRVDALINELKKGDKK